MAELKASKAWMDSFSKLGQEQSDFNDYDVAFYVHIKDLVSQYQSASLSCSHVDLDKPISLVEVQSVVKNLKKGKAVGINGIIMNEFSSMVGIK